MHPNDRPLKKRSFGCRGLTDKKIVLAILFPTKGVTPGSRMAGTKTNSWKNRSPAMRDPMEGNGGHTRFPCQGVSWTWSVSQSVPGRHWVTGLTLSTGLAVGPNRLLGTRISSMGDPRDTSDHYLHHGWRSLSPLGSTSRQL